MGSIPGAFLAALLIGEIKAFCIGIGSVTLFGTVFSLSKFTLVVEFIVMAVVQWQLSRHWQRKRWLA
jgi:branched-chain amino acid transport system permease protein